ncbi:MAG: protein kinase [Proteobacteria bacterium]|nr:protein kinase [Pseudomonadota bacterium]
MPEQFGTYWLLDRIAVGGMAEVFRAKTFGAQGFEKVLVIKRILDRFADDADFVEMFIDEAKLSASLAHPNIAQIFDFGKEGSNYFIAMEAVDGQDLKSLLRRLAERGERMPIEYACYMGHQIARGLDYAHKRSDAMGLPLNIVHRDVSPSNAIVSYEGQIKIVDFGIAHAESANRESESGVLKGKYSYMSPEQASGFEVDHRSDVFSTGICLWEMLTGNRLFRYASEIETLEAIKACAVPPPSEYNPDVPPELDEICLIALAREPSARYQQASDMQHALTDFMLPTTPDRVAPQVATWMRTHFGEDIRQARERLDRGTQLAAELHFGGELDLILDEEEAPTDEVVLPVAAVVDTETVRPPAPAPPTNRVVLGALLLISALLLTLLVLVYPLLFPTVQNATLAVTVLPGDIDGLVMSVDGTVAESTEIELAPEVPHELTITAPGFATRTKTIELVSGQVYAIEVQLQPDTLGELEEPTPEPVGEAGLGEDLAPIEAAPTPRPRPQPTPAAVTEVPDLPQPEPAGAEPSTLFFASRPAGASVVVDGTPVGSTPFAWEAGDSGRSYAIEFRLDGFKTVRATATAPEPGATTRISRELPSVEAVKPGKLNVQATPGWAKVYIDGAYVSTTPLIGHELPAGQYSIRLVNDRLGADISDTINVTGGQTTIKAYQLDR